MTTGWDRGFIIEKEKNKYSKRFSCALCEYFDSDDKSCRKRGLYIPSIGYGEWKYCKEIKYIPNGDYSTNHIEQLVKAEKGFAIAHVSIKRANDPFDRKFDVKPYFYFHPKAIKSEYRSNMERINSGDTLSLGYMIPLVPVEFKSTFINFLCVNDNDSLESFVYVVACFISSVSNRNVSIYRKKVRSLAKRFKKYWGNQVITGTETTINLYTLSKAFIIFYAREYETFVDEHRDDLDNM